MRKSTTKQLPLLQWNILSRSSKPLDWAWVGGVVLVSVVVGMVLGAKYIGLALILYVFVFCMALRGWIRASYPAEEGTRYYIDWEFNWPSYAGKLKAQLLTLKFFIVLFGIMVVFDMVIHMLVPPGYVVEVATLTTLTLCGGFVLLRYKALFVSCFGGGKLAASSQQRVQRLLGKRRASGGFSVLRLLRLTLLWLLVWVGMGYAYATGQLGGTHAFGYNLTNLPTDYYGIRLFGPALITFCPALIHLIFFEQLTKILRGWEEYYDG